MDALTLLQLQADNADRTLQLVCKPVTPDQAAWQFPGSTANTVAATLMHSYYSQDEVIQRFRGQPTVFETGGWQPRTVDA